MVARIPVGDLDLRWGDDQAPVTAVIFGRVGDDMTGRSLALLEKLQAATGKQLRIVWKSHAPVAIPFATKHAQLLAGIARTDGAAVARKFLDLTRANQASLHEAEKLFGYAREAGVKDMNAFQQRVTSEEFSPQIQDDNDLAGRLGVDLSPAVFVNGYRLAGRIKESALKAVFDDELAKADALLKMGKTPGDAYALRTQQNTENKQDFPFNPPSIASGSFHRVLLGSAPLLGDPKAPVTLVMFGGYQDPFSQRAHKTIEALRKRYKKDLRIAWKDTPLGFHSFAMHTAALAAEARAQGGDAAFWKAHDRMLDSAFWQKHRQDMDAKSRNPQTLDAIGRELGLKKAGHEAAIDAKNLQMVANDQAQSKALNVNATPTFFINGQAILGAQTEDKFREIIDQELARARARIKAGTRPEQVYEATMADIKEAEE